MIALLVAATLNLAQVDGGARCPGDYGVHEAAAAAPRRLDRLPRADLLLTVYREVDLCPAPLIVRQDVKDAGRDH